MKFFVPFALLLASGSTVIGQDIPPPPSPAPIPSPVLQATTPYVPITGEQRLAWFANAAAGPRTLLGGLTRAGLATWRNSPEEYGTHWKGFGQRYGSGLATNALASGIEAGAGSLWGEDPRYFRVPEEPFKRRIGHVVKMTFVSHNASGREMPAYARFVAVSSSAFISNSWRPDSQTSAGDTFGRIGTMFVNRALGNALAEFWPDIRKRIFRHRAAPAPPTSNTVETLR